MNISLFTSHMLALINLQCPHVVDPSDVTPFFGFSEFISAADLPNYFNPDLLNDKSHESELKISMVLTVHD
jgi:hypothetical protein